VENLVGDAPEQQSDPIRQAARPDHDEVDVLFVDGIGDRPIRASERS
jgi:hypothetical protein